jgi:hypothetical protein
MAKVTESSRSGSTTVRSNPRAAATPAERKPVSVTEGKTGNTTVRSNKTPPKPANTKQNRGKVSITTNATTSKPAASASNNSATTKQGAKITGNTSTSSAKVTTGRGGTTPTRSAPVRAKAAPPRTGADAVLNRLGNEAWVTGKGALNKAGKVAAKLPKNLTVAKLGGAATALTVANAIQDKLLSPEQLKVKRENEISRENMLKSFKAAPKTGPKAGNYQSRFAGATERTRDSIARTGRGSSNAAHQSRFAGAREANLARINSDPRFAAPQPAPRSPAIGAPIHARPAAFGAAQGGLGGSADAPGSVYAPKVPQRPSTPGQAVQQAAAASETYRDGGKGLYQGTEEYRKAVGGSGNPLLNRFRQDMGLDPETGARQDAAPTPQELPAENPYAGIGDLRGLSIKDNVPAVAQNPELAGAPNLQYEGNDEPGKLGQADDPIRALAELLLRNKLKISVN